MNVAHHCLKSVQWRDYPGDIILWCVRWYLRYPISFTHMSEMAEERGLQIDASCIWRWVQVFGPELDERCRRHLKPRNRIRTRRAFVLSMINAKAPKRTQELRPRR